jgi:ankyrin repeat protein
LGHFDLCEIIIQYLWNKNPSNIDAVTPLHEAARQGHLKICSLIIDHTNDIDVEDNEGQTPKHLAKENGHHEVEKLFDYQ